MSVHYRDREPTGCAGALAALAASLVVCGALAWAAHRVGCWIARMV